jgi:protein transport protein SEC23
MDVNQDEINGIRFSWNVLPSNRIDATKIIVPAGFHYSPVKKIETMQLLEYDPLHCAQCRSILNPAFPVNFKAKSWECAFCKTRNNFPSVYAQAISETNLPSELMQENTTVEYKLSKKDSNPPIFIFLIDTTVEEEELNELKDSIQQVLTTLPQDCLIGIITFGAMVNVQEIGFSEFPVAYSFKGEKLYKTVEIQEQLGLITIQRQVGGTNPHVQTHSGNRFIVPLKDCEFTVNSFLDDLEIDPFPKKQGERHPNCAGLALHVAVSMLETLGHGDPSRILFFLGNAPCIGHGQVIGKPFLETIRNYVDFEKANPNTKYYKPALEFYDVLASRASKSGIIVDLFSCCLNQVGLYEMRNLVEKTGGYMVLTDFFSTVIFKDSFKKLFEIDEFGNLKMNFRGKIEVLTTNPVKLSGAVGHLVSLEQNGTNVSDVKIGEGGTRSWSVGGMDQNSTYTFIFDLNGTPNQAISKFATIQVLTSYIAGDRSQRLRVTTVTKKVLMDLNSQPMVDEVAHSFDQEAASVLLARLCVVRGYTEESREILKWVDKTLIRLISKFSKFNRDDPKSFKLQPQFNYFPQFMFYLRRSNFIQNFNASPDEITFYKTSLMHENVINATIMIQPVLFTYTPEVPDASPVFLDVDSMKNDHVLLLDRFFFVVVWHGEEVCKWRDAEYHLDPEYENIKLMLENPQEYAQSIIAERIPVPKFVSCDSGSGQERLVKFTVNPSNTSGSKNKVVEEGFVSDDVSLKVFMDFLVKLAVSS